MATNFRVMQKIGVFTSGGDSPGMNACIRAVVRTCIYHGLDAWGIERGYQGLIDGDMKPMGSHDVSGIIQLGGTILRSARSEDFRTTQGRRKAYDSMKAAGLDGLVAIGGDGTFTGAQVFMEEFPDIAIVGCPGTIDNDLYGTDYTIGYDTAINTAMNAIDNIKDTANAHDRLFFVEVMGRDAGFIALLSGIASGVEAILIPENKTSIDTLIQTLENNYQRKKNASIVVVAEGEDAGGAFKVAEQVKARFSRYEIKVSILGHLQRGGRPSCMDRVRASRMGISAVEALMAGSRGVMIGEQNRKMVEVPFEQAIKHNLELNPTLVKMVEILS